MDSQTKELIGRHVLADQLLRAGIEVAIPLRDRGVDLIAYREDCDDGGFVARPIQMKAATRRSFSLDRKYERVGGLLLAYVWHINDPATSVTYVMTYPEARTIAETMGWLVTPTWAKRGYYANNNPGKKLVALLEPFRMSNQRWNDRMVEMG